MPISRSDISRIVARVNARELIRRGQPIIQASVERFGQRGRNLVDSGVFNVRNPRVGEFLRRWGAERMSKNVNRTTKSRLRVVLARGIDANKTTEALAKDIGQVFEVAKGSRARMIARTEILRASNFATVEGFKQAGLSRKEWQSTLGPTTRDWHAEMDGQIVEMNEDFESGLGNKAPYPGEFGVAEEDINCQCGVLPVIDERRIVNRGMLWKSLQRERVPYRRRLQTAMRAGFSAQEQRVMEEFDSLSA